MREEPKEYEIYRHFKGSFYQIVAVAVHTETKEKMVIYRALKNSSHVFARPLSMFMSEVDKDKYKDVSVKYRFTKIEDDEVNITLGKDLDEKKYSEYSKDEINDAVDITHKGDKNDLVNITKDNNKNDEVDIILNVNESKAADTDISGNGKDSVDIIRGDDEINALQESEKDMLNNDEENMDTCKYKEDGTLVIDPLVERLLDEKEFTKKIEVLQLLRNKCTEEMLTQIAISLDIKLTSDTIEGNYAEILKVLRMHEKYESGRRI